MARDLLVNVIGGIVVTILLGLVAFLWDGVFAPLWATSRVSFALLCVAFLVIGLAAGFAIGWGVRGRRIGSEAAKAKEDRKRGEENKRREEEKRRANEIETSAMDFLREPCGEKKAMAAVIYRQPDHRIPLNCRGVTEIESLENNHGFSDHWTNFFMTDARGDDVTFVVLERWVVELFDAKPELLDDFTPSMLEECETLLRDCEPF